MQKWILYCDEVIGKFSDVSKDLDEVKLYCTTDCGKSEQCKYVVYYGL